MLLRIARLWTVELFTPSSEKPTFVAVAIAVLALVARVTFKPLMLVTTEPNRAEPTPKPVAAAPRVTDVLFVALPVTLAVSLTPWKFTAVAVVREVLAFP